MTSKISVAIQKMKFWIQKMKFWIQGMIFWIQKMKFWIQGMIFWIQKMKFWIQGMIFWIQGMIFWIQKMKFCSQKMIFCIQKMKFCIQGTKFCGQKMGFCGQKMGFCGQRMIFCGQRMIFWIQKTKFCIQETNFCARGTVFCARGMNFCARGTLFCARGMTFCARGMKFCARGMNFCARGMNFCARGMNFCARGMNFYARREPLLNAGRDPALVLDGQLEFGRYFPGGGRFVFCAEGRAERDEGGVRAERAGAADNGRADVQPGDTAGAEDTGDKEREDVSAKRVVRDGRRLCRGTHGKRRAAGVVAGVKRSGGHNGHGAGSGVRAGPDARHIRTENGICIGIAAEEPGEKGKKGDVFPDLWRAYNNGPLVSEYGPGAAVRDSVSETLVPAGAWPPPEPGEGKYIGYPYESRFRTLPGNSARTLSPSRVAAARFRLLESHLPFIKGHPGGMVNRMVHPLWAGRLDGVRDGVVAVPVPGAIEQDAAYEVFTSVPAPLTVVCMVEEEDG
jgi:hypothetical protein